MVIYELASHLHMPVYQIYNEMPYDELLKWLEYFNKRPYGWRDDDRAFKIIQAWGGSNIKPYQVFASLEPIYKASEERKERGEISVQNLRQSTMFSKMLSAKGGEDIAKVINNSVTGEG
jgi:hypothetical protein